MKIEFRKHENRKFLLLVAQTVEERKYLSLLGADGETLTATFRNKPELGDYVRFELPEMDSSFAPAMPAYEQDKKSAANMLINDIPIAHCRDCRCEIFWLINESTGKKAPIDALPSVEGNCAITSKTHYTVLAGARLAEEKAKGAALHTNHFKTCEYAQNFRR